GDAAHQAATGGGDRDGGAGGRGVPGGDAGGDEDRGRIAVYLLARSPIAVAVMAMIALMSDSPAIMPEASGMAYLSECLRLAFSHSQTAMAPIRKPTALLKNTTHERPRPMAEGRYRRYFEGVSRSMIGSATPIAAPMTIAHFAESGRKPNPLVSTRATASQVRVAGAANFSRWALSGTIRNQMGTIANVPKKTPK